MPYKTIQQNFSKGEINPKLLARTDIDMYYSSCSKMRNVSIMPYGGFSRRKGTKFIDKVGQGSELITGLSITAQNGGNSNYINDNNRGTFFITNNIDTTSDFVVAHYFFNTNENLQFIDIQDIKLNSYSATANINVSVNPLINVNTFTYDTTDLIVEILLASAHNGNTDNTFKITYSNGTDSYTKDVVVEVIDVNTIRYNDEIVSGYNPIKAQRLNGSITSITIVDGGKGYINPTYEIVGIGSGAVLSPVVNPAGIITSINVTSGGDDYLNPILNISKTDLSINLTVQGSIDNITWEDVGILSINETDNSYRLLVDKTYRYVRIIRVGNGEIRAGVVLSEFNARSKVELLDSTIRMFPFSFNLEQNYIIVVSNRNISIYKNDVRIASITTIITSDMIPTLKFTQNADTCIFVQENLPPQKLVRGVNDTVWTIQNINFNGLPKKSITFPESLTRADNNGNWYVDFSDLEGTSTFTSNTNLFANDKFGTGWRAEGQYLMLGEGGSKGRVRIIKKISDNQAVCSVVIPILKKERLFRFDITTSYQDAWGSSLGYPKSVCFYENRLWFGGSKKYPTTIWGSKSSLFFDFTVDESYSGASIDVDIDAKELNEIIDLFPQRNLQIFTTGGEFIIPQNPNEAITFENITIRNQTQVGMWKKTRPIDIDGKIFFIDKNGSILTKFVYDFQQDAYSSSAYSLLSSHLISKPLSMNVERNEESQASNYVYIVNEDGTICQGNILDEQDINGYSLLNTDGEFKDVCINYDGVYMLVERVINGEINLFLERQEELTLDCVKSFNVINASSVSGMDYLNAKIVSIMVDGKFFENRLVINGNIDFEELLTGRIDIGLNYNVMVEGNPIEMQQMGIGIGKKKRIAEITCRLIDTQNLVINDELADSKELEKKEVDYTFYGIGDWSEKERFLITQNKPEKLNILGIQMNVNYEVANE